MVVDLGGPESPPIATRFMFCKAKLERSLRFMFCKAKLERPAAIWRSHVVRGQESTNGR